MKGSRAKKQAEEAARAASGGGETAANGVAPAPPEKPREGPPRPNLPNGINGAADFVKLPSAEFIRICSQLRTNQLLGAAAADALETAAGISEPQSPQSQKAKTLRSEVAENREEDPPEEKKKKKKGACMFGGEAEELPEPEYEDPPPDEEEEEQNDKPAVPDLDLNPKQNKMRTDIEMWVMDEIAVVYGVDDSEELADDLQEDGQADTITFILAEDDETKQQEIVDKWLKDAPDPDAKNDFMTQLLEKCRAVLAVAPKKKKKKKKDK